MACLLHRGMSCANVVDLIQFVLSCIIDHFYVTVQIVWHTNNLSILIVEKLTEYYMIL